MRSPGHRLAALALVTMASGGAGCTGEGVDRSGSGPEVGTMRLGRVHVVLEPEGELYAGEEVVDTETFEVTARFAFVQGFEEDFVRARIDMPVLATDVVRPGECVASEQLATVAVADADLGVLDQDLHLVDAGNLSVQIGEDNVEVPLSLVPDLLPYMHGVEYLYYGDELPSALSDEGGRVVVRAEGSQTEELPPFRVEGTVPAALALHVTEDDLRELSRDALVLRWQGEPTGEGNIAVRLTGLTGGEPVGTELTCVLSDVGQTRLAFDGLRPLGLMLDAEALKITAIRLQSAHFDAGEFVGAELFIERREKLVLPLR